MSVPWLKSTHDDLGKRHYLPDPELLFTRQKSQSRVHDRSGVASADLCWKGHRIDSLAQQIGAGLGYVR